MCSHDSGLCIPRSHSRIWAGIGIIGHNTDSAGREGGSHKDDEI